MARGGGGTEILTIVFAMCRGCFFFFVCMLFLIYIFVHGNGEEGSRMG